MRRRVRPGKCALPRCGLLSALALVVAPLAVQGAYLRNVPQLLTQPDGTVVHLLATGDEYYNWLHDSAGYVIVRDPKNGVLVYATKVDGRLTPTTLVVGRSDPSHAGLTKGLKPDRRFIPDPSTLFPGPMLARALGTPGVPSFSSINNIVVFIRFADDAEFSAPFSAYDGLFNPAIAGVNSLRNYFWEASYQQLTVTSTFYPIPSGGYVVSYKDSQPRAYYKPYDATTNLIGYDKNSTTARYEREFALLMSAVNAIAAQVPNSLNLDTNGDGKVDSVCFIVSGGAVSAEWSNLLWPHRSSLHYAYPLTATINGKTVDDYNFQLNDGQGEGLGVGVLCHEMTHTLGAPDLYHYENCSSAKELSPVGNWDLMGNTQDPPQHMDAYLKYRYLGWIPSMPQITSSGTYSLQPLTSAANNCYKIASPNSSTEYFLVEYRRKTGTFEYSVPGSGLLVYRIKTDVPSIQSGNDCGPPDEVYLYRPGGSTTTNGSPDDAHLGVDVLRPSINDTTDPSSFLSDGNPGGLSITNIGSAGNTISFAVTLGEGTGATTTIFSDNFEGPFPGNWELWKGSGSATTEWGRVSCTSSTGSGSAWCAAGGSAPQPPCSQYVGNMNSWMKYGPFSLADATEASAEFDVWYNTEPYNDSTKEGDRFWWIISVDGQNYMGYPVSGSSGGWTHKVFNFRDITSFSAIGSATVWFAFAFESDPLVQGGGAYVDNLVISKTIAAACAYSILPTSQSFAATGGDDTVNVTITSGTNCSWTAASNAAWISITSGASGSGNGSVGYSVSANAGEARTGTLTIAGQTFTVSQAAPACAYSIVPASQSFAASGGSDTVTVTVTSGTNCSWTATSNAAWISITSGASGTGNGSVGYSVGANTGGARTGTLTIASQTFTVDQAAPACAYSILPTSQSFAASGGSDTVNVTVTAGGNCSWTAVSNASWIAITSGATGTGNGSVGYSVAANSGSARSGSVTIGGQTLTVDQASGRGGLDFSHWIGAVSHVDGAANSHWRSDVAVLNRSSSPAAVEYRLYSPEGLKTQRVTLAGNAQDFHRDIARWLDYWTGSGALEIRSDQDVFVMGRTYNQVDAIHTYGQNYDSHHPDAELLSAGQSAWLPLLAQNVDFRCNIAITNTGTTAATVTLTLYDGQGNQLWSGSDESNNLPPDGFVQYLKPFQKYTGRNNIEQGYAKITVSSGWGIIAWASVVDENTGDPTTISMQR